MTALYGAPLDTAVNAAFDGAGTIGSAPEWRVREVRNEHPTYTVTAPKLYTRQDPAGGAYAVAVADPVARPLSYVWPVPNPAGFVYSTPTDPSNGLALPTLPPSTKCLIAERRDLTGATEARPEHNALIVAGTVPADYT